MTGDAPGEVVLDDLRRPRFAPEVAALFADAAGLADALELSVDALCEQAVTEAGLDDFGDPGFAERLGVLVDALGAVRSLSPVGRVSVHTQLVQMLKNRLLIQDQLTRHPEILDLEVRAPVIICGLPRTGTTHLHNLISADPQWRSLPYWESLEPVPPLDEQDRPVAPDPRLARTEAALDVVNSAMPHLRRMHDMTVDHVHEEIHLLAVDFSSTYFDTMAPMPAWREWYRTTDQTPHYEYLRTVLKVLQFLRGPDRWVLKSPQHLEQFGPLAKVFPDATYVVTHRDPVAVLVSMATMLAYTSRMTHDPVPVDEIVGYWSSWLDEVLTVAVEDRHRLPADQSIDVRFDEFMADDVAMVERIYALADAEFTPAVEERMATFMRAHPRGRHGTVRYEPERLGLDLGEWRERLRPYAEHFGV